MSYKIEQIDDYQSRLTDEQAKKVIEHCNENDVFPNICAWYDDMDDFYSDWCGEIDYSEEDADDLLIGSDGQFLIFDDKSIVRFSM